MNSNFFKAIFLLIAITFPTNLWAKPAEMVMSWNGYGNLRFGDDLQTMEKWMGEKAVIRRSGDEGCYFVDFPDYPEVSFMMENDILARVYRNSDKVKTFINISIGDSVAEINRAFRGKMCPVASREYIDEPKNCHIIVYPSDGGYYYLFLNKLETKGFILEEHDGKVVEFSAGLARYLTLKEGCQ